MTPGLDHMPDHVAMFVFHARSIIGVVANVISFEIDQALVVNALKPHLRGVQPQLVVGVLDLELHGFECERQAR